MNELQIFNSEEFGDIRTVTIENEPMFCLSDVCKALGLTQPSKVKDRLNEKGVNTIPTLTAGGEQKLLYINESNLYKTIFQSRKESAERFTDWVTSEVLPAIRKTGSYQKPMTIEEQLQIVAKGTLEVKEEIHRVDNDLQNFKADIFSTFKWTSWTTCVSGTSLYIKNIKKPNNELYTAQELKELSIDFDVIYQLLEQQETDLTPEQTQALKELVTYYPVTNISVNSEQLDGYTVFNYPISMQNGWNYVKQQLNDNRDYIYDMDIQSAEAYVNSEYAVALTELEV